MQYSAFGLTIATTDPVPGLNADTRRSAVDLRIWLDGRWPDDGDSLSEDLWYTGDVEDETTPDLHVWAAAGRHFRFCYDDGVEFIVDRTGTEVWGRWPAASTREDAVTYLLGPVMGFVLRLRGVVCLHASAVALGDRAVLIAGAPEAGKSSTAAAFCRNGHAILSDDVAPIVEAAGALYVQPSYPQLRLWPDSVAALYGSPSALPRLTPTWDKRALDLRTAAGGFQADRLPLAAIYVLDERTGGERCGHHGIVRPRERHGARRQFVHGLPARSCGAGPRACVSHARRRQRSDPAARPARGRDAARPAVRANPRRL